MQCGKTQTLFLYCDICGAVLTETPSGYLSCPSGHGKLKMRIEALLKFPKAELAAGRVYRIAGKEGLFVAAAARPSRKTCYARRNGLKRPEVSVDGFTLARFRGRPTWFKPLKQGKKKRWKSVDTTPAELAPNPPVRQRQAQSNPAELAAA